MRFRTSGFTLIELLVTLGVLALLSSLLIVYTRTSENQIRLLKDKATVISALYRARSLALNSVQTPGFDCGYGLKMLTDHTMILWRDIGRTSCNDANTTYDGANENVGEPIELSRGVTFGNFGAVEFLGSILFIPPDPTVVTEPRNVAGGQFQLTLKSSDGRSATTIGVNRFGQVEPAAGY